MNKGGQWTAIKPQALLRFRNDFGRPAESNERFFISAVKVIGWIVPPVNSQVNQH